MPGRDDCAVVFVVKRCAAKVNYPHRRALHRSLVSFLTANQQHIDSQET